MVAKSKGTGEKKGKVKVDKLKLNKESVKELSDSEAKGVKGGAGALGGASAVATPNCFPCQSYVARCTQSCTGGNVL